MLKTSWMLLKIKLKLYYTVQGKKHILLKKEKSGEVASKHSSSLHIRYINVVSFVWVQVFFFQFCTLFCPTSQEWLIYDLVLINISLFKCTKKKKFVLFNANGKWSKVLPYLCLRLRWARRIAKNTILAKRNKNGKIKTAKINLNTSLHTKSTAECQEPRWRKITTCFSNTLFEMNYSKEPIRRHERSLPITRCDTLRCVCACA